MESLLDEFEFLVFLVSFNLLQLAEGEVLRVDRCSSRFQDVVSSNGDRWNLGALFAEVLDHADAGILRRTQHVRPLALHAHLEIFEFSRLT